MGATIVLVLAVIVLETAAATWEPKRSRGHLRPQSPAAVELVDRAISRVPEVAALVEALESSDVFVYVTDAAVGGPGDPPAYLRFLTCAGGRRLLVIRIDHSSIPPEDRIVVLAHELQHAAEIAAHPDVRDAHGLAALYRRIGWEASHGCFETDAAVRVTKVVRAYLARTRF